MNIPEELMYTRTHEWVQFESEMTAYVGITDYAQSSLGDLVFINLPEEDDEITAGEAFADVESVKAVSDVLAPVSGLVIQVNQDLLDAPEAINEMPYQSWLVLVDNVSGKENLMTSQEYEQYIESLEE